MLEHTFDYTSRGTWRVLGHPKFPRVKEAADVAGEVGFAGALLSGAVSEIPQWAYNGSGLGCSKTEMFKKKKISNLNLVVEWVGTTEYEDCIVGWHASLLL